MRVRRTRWQRSVRLGLRVLWLSGLLMLCWWSLPALLATGGGRLFLVCWATVVIVAAIAQLQTAQELWPVWRLPARRKTGMGQQQTVLRQKVRQW